jgi:hypothetical protein
MPHKDIAYVPPRTNVCPTCGLQHRLVDDEFVHALERLDATPEQIAMIQEESDDLATAYGVENDPHKAPKDAPPTAEGKREYERDKKRRQRARQKGQQ